jgi:hypothetical protein
MNMRDCRATFGIDRDYYSSVFGLDCIGVTHGHIGLLELIKAFSLCSAIPM